MILKTVRIENYRCIEDSEEFSLAPVTCLVGKNESGKSSILESLYKLNPVITNQANFDVVGEYPRRSLSEFEEGILTDRANVLTTHWELTEEESKSVEEEIGLGVLRSRIVQVSKGYDNKLVWSVDIDEKVVMRYCIDQCGISDFDLEKLDGIKGLLNQLEAREIKTEKEIELYQFILKKFPTRSVLEATIDIITKFIPRLVYFSQYQILPGQVSVDQLIQRRNQGQLTSQDNTFIALLDLAGTTIDSISQIQDSEHLTARLESVSNRISNQIFEYWSQNKDLSVLIKFEPGRPNDSPPYNQGYIFRTRIYNQRHKSSVLFDERSSGFIWFFSFLVWFSHIQKVYGQNLLLLLDEPGLNLHAKAQADLLRYIKEKLEPKYQVIYTTHSPFMVDIEKIMSVRTVEDVSTKTGDVLGTKVGEQVLATDSDTLFPLQAALGYDITQTLFVGKHTLLVEGPSDLLYLTWFSTQLKNRNREGLDKKWTVAPAGGVDKISSFIALFGGNKLHVAVLTDYADGDKKKIKSLRESELLRQGHVFTAEMYVKQPEADVEDLLGNVLYSRLVNQCYGLEGELEFNPETSQSRSVRIVKKVEEYFSTLPPEVKEFDHYQPSVYLMEHPEKDWPDLEMALERFEKFFKDVNSLLN